MQIVLCLLVAMCQPKEQIHDNPRGELDTAVPHFAKLLEDDKIAEFIDTAIDPSRLKDYQKRLTREELVDYFRKIRKDVAKGLRQIHSLHLKPEESEPLLKEDEKVMTFTFPDGGMVTFYRRKGLWYGAF
jgi:hypothetical protein